MELAPLTKILENKAIELDSTLSGLKWYLFGSLLNDKKCSADIDILIIYEDEKAPKVIKSHLQDLNLLLPLHIIFMTTKEEAELKFIEKNKALLIFP